MISFSPLLQHPCEGLGEPKVRTPSQGCAIKGAQRAIHAAFICAHRPIADLEHGARDGPRVRFVFTRVSPDDGHLPHDSHFPAAGDALGGADRHTRAEFYCHTDLHTHTDSHYHADLHTYTDSYCHADALTHTNSYLCAYTHAN